MADWEEIKRLAADFQRTQTSDTLQRLSERNCIDIVKKLTDLHLIELIYTCDGKEFLTPEHLLKEIEDEVYVNSGRVHLHDLATRLNVDYQHIERLSKTIAKEKPDEYNLILGQIIHSKYKNTLEKQIYDTMITTGQLSISDMAKTLDLPSEFLSKLVKESLPSVMDDFVVSPDEKTYYSSDFMDRYKSIIAGTLTAITKPTSVATIMKKLDIPERLFSPIVDGLLRDGRIDALIENRIFVPSVHAREQNEWVDQFYTSNSYIDYDVLTRKDIKQPKAFLKKRFPDGMQLKTCFVSPLLVSQVESLVEDCIAMNSLIDITSIIPPTIQPVDIEMILQDIFKRNRSFASSCMIFNQVNVCSLGYIEVCRDTLKQLMDSRAKEHLKEGRLVSHFLGTQMKKTALVKQKSEPPQNPEVADKTNIENQTGDGDKTVSSVSEMVEEKLDDKGDKGSSQQKNVENIDLVPEDQVIKKSKSSRKSGGGTQGREIKQKSTKKKYLTGKSKNNDDSEDEVPATKAPRSSKGRAARRGVSPETSSKNPPKVEKEPLIFLSSDKLIEKLRVQLREAGDFSDELFESLANVLEGDLNKTYEVVARKVLDVHLKSLENKENQTSGKEEEIDENDVIDLVE